MTALRALCFALLLPLASAAQAQVFGSKSGLPAAFTLPQDVVLPERTPNEAAEKAQEMTGGGKILSVEPVSGGYRVKLLKDGEVKIVMVPD